MGGPRLRARRLLGMDPGLRPPEEAGEAPATAREPEHAAEYLDAYRAQLLRSLEPSVFDVRPLSYLQAGQRTFTCARTRFEVSGRMMSESSTSRGVPGPAGDPRRGEALRQHALDRLAQRILETLEAIPRPGPRASRSPLRPRRDPVAAPGCGLLHFPIPPHTMGSVPRSLNRRWRPPPTKLRNRRILIAVGCVVGVLGFGYWLSDIFNPLLFAALLAYICEPLVVRLQRVFRRRLLSIVFIYVYLLVLVVVLPSSSSALSRRRSPSSRTR